MEIFLLGLILVALMDISRRLWNIHMLLKKHDWYR
jgi:hypothetical protein